MNKFEKVDPLKIPSLLEGWFRKQGATPSVKEEYRGYTYYLAEGGPHFDAKDHEAEKDTNNNDPDFYKQGYYVAAFCFMCDNKMYNINTPFGLSIHFKINHDPGDTEEGKRLKRINSARAECKHFMDIIIDDASNHLLEKRDLIWTPNYA